MSASVLTGRERRLLPLISVCVSDGSRERITGEELGEGHRGETAHGWWAGCCRERWDCVEEVTLQHTAEWQCWAGCHIRRLPYCHKQEVAWLTWWRNTHTARAHTHTHTHTFPLHLHTLAKCTNVIPCLFFSGDEDVAVWKQVNLLSLSYSLLSLFNTYIYILSYVLSSIFSYCVIYRYSVDIQYICPVPPAITFWPQGGATWTKT